MILIRGKARKSVYMDLFYKSSKSALFILYGSDYPIQLEPEMTCWDISRSQKTQHDQFELEAELIEIMAQVLDQTKFKNVFLYGNFAPQEIEVLAKVNRKLDGQLTIVASIHDNSVPDGQIIIDESIR